jgi:putative tricarboxylic transport membrane protein
VEDDMTNRFSRRDMLRISAAGSAMLAAPSILRAQAAFPTRPINVIVPFDTGGYNDRLARAFAPMLQAELGQPLNIINRGGAGALLGHTFFQAQPDDGYSILCTSIAPFAPLNILTQNAPFAIEDFYMINLPSQDYTLMATSADSDVESIEQVLESLRADPTSLSIGIQPASADLVNLSILMEANDIDMDALRIVTYDGGGPARNATAGGVVDVGLVGGEGFVPLAEQVRPLLTFNDTRRDFDGPLITDVLGADAAFVSGSQRGWGIHASMLDSHPDRAQIIIDAVERASLNPDNIASLESQNLATTWYGPETSNQQVRNTARVMEQYLHLLTGN